ncbi:multidrug efflux SMR transporter [Microcoleus sp. herbarium2]|uniref:multidrug efflux SMR transporter n=1 Tax=Microcoleus sp. herbarium2 TaxID=3055433 RepID=UPI002FCEFEB1
MPIPKPHYSVSWIYLMLAVVLEAAGTIYMKFSEGFTKVVPSVLMLVFYGISFIFLNLAIKKLDVSVAYSIFSGLGIALVAIGGIFFFKDPLTVFRIAAISLIIIGVVILNLTGVSH